MKDALADSVISYLFAAGEKYAFLVPATGGKEKSFMKKTSNIPMNLMMSILTRHGQSNTFPLIRIPHDFVLEMIQFALPINLNIIK